MSEGTNLPYSLVEFHFERLSFLRKLRLEQSSSNVDTNDHANVPGSICWRYAAT